MSTADELFTAARTGETAQVAALLDAEPTLIHAAAPNGDSLLLTALYHGQPAVVDILRARGVRMNVWEAAATGDVDQLTSHLDRDPGLLHAYSHDGWTPLHLAAFTGQADAVKLLIERGANVAARSHNGLDNHPLHAAVAGAQSLDVVRLLLDAGSDVNARQHGGFTPLHEAAQNGNGLLVDVLLAYGATLDATTDDGKSAWTLATEAGQTDVADLLANFGATA